MLIESIIRRAKGTKIVLGDVTYAFRPDDDGRHVADVEDQGHIATLLAIKEGFRSADGSLHGDVATGLPQIDGPYFLVRGAQDVRAFTQWAMSIPEMTDNDLLASIEAVLLVDKIAIGEASLGGFDLAHLPESPVNFIPDEPPAKDSPPASAANTILPVQSQAGEGEGAATGDAPASGDGGGDAAGGIAADRPVPQSDRQPDREDLAIRYAELKGHRPNGKWDAEKIARAIAEHQG